MNGLCNWRWPLAGALLPLLLACSPGSQTPPAESAGQVKPQAELRMNFYAASRAAEQVSFGANPALVAELQRKGLASWIDEQFALPPSTAVSPTWVRYYDDKNELASNRAGNFPSDQFWRRALSAPDQLRQRVTWALFQFIPVAQGQPNGQVQYYNMLINNAFGTYPQLLHEVTVQPMMGWYLNNETNRPPSPQCLGCTPNENYARELMQLFSIGVVQLNSDGSVIRDANGKPRETYTQKDVEALARALTGWRGAWDNDPLSKMANFDQRMTPEAEAFLHDSKAKVVMGMPLVAGMGAAAELDAVIALLMQHPNVAPFVSLRLIQHLVTSNPSPAYLSRISTVFRNNGSGVAGDLRAVVKAILLDPEARAGDVPGQQTRQSGKFREPVQWMSALMRGLACTAPLYSSDGKSQWVVGPPGQPPNAPPSVFSFYQATDRVPGSNLLAPEQKIVGTMELNSRLGMLNWHLLDSNNPASASNRSNSGCDLSTPAQLLRTDPTAFLDMVSQRWFRGAMPPTLRSKMATLMQSETWNSNEEGALTMIQFALASPYYGVMR
ncbi:DUF1800 family protein [Pseudoduganella danionis]|uniref:DUF1800 family protein n=1 Tax=Pseudoduganella danionis TaxID=1890295 RepID=A0ABW9SLJ4_9BURK|nr:DUF1800 family protein [Pseudoduganella danionis]MTW32836.1 DUF1800 family protein [Pseudoduganella danionis]